MKTFDELVLGEKVWALNSKNNNVSELTFIKKEIFEGFYDNIIEMTFKSVDGTKFIISYNEYDSEGGCNWIKYDVTTEIYLEKEIVISILEEAINNINKTLKTLKG